MSFLTDDYRSTTIRRPREILSGLDATAHYAVGAYRRATVVVSRFLDRALDVDTRAAAWKDLSEESLRSRLLEFKEAFRRRKRGYERLVPDALAAVREAADRQVGLRAYVVQLAGALALHDGYVVEMATGEGKTLTACLTSVLNGWTGVPCHVITVNDYLAQRDAEWSDTLYSFCGLSVGHVIGEMEHPLRREGYRKDVTYTTSKEIVADFLRDRLWLGELQNAGRRQIRMLFGRRAEMDRGRVMRGIHTAIADEVDSVLIDEAVTPLIISKPQTNEPFVLACRSASQVASRLKRGVDYTIDDRYREVELEPNLEERLNREADAGTGMAGALGRRMELIHQALTAREFFHRDIQYVVQNDKVVIVDEFTGRLMPMRSWRAGLHQFVEAKEGVPITPPTETLARLSFQRFFRFFKKLSGMSGTVQEAAPEFWHIYELPVVAIPENRPCQRVEYPSLVFVEKETKWEQVVADIIYQNQRKRPVLVGTRSVEASEYLASKLTAIGLPYRLLNATRHREEARIVAHAGEKSAVTIATNMAGRGTDIKLEIGVAELGGLHVIATEWHEARRIDRQLFGRCARQGDPGTSRAYISLEDELPQRYLPKPVLRSLALAMERDSRASQWLAAKACRWAQATAERLAFRRRRSVLQMDTWLEDSLSFAGTEPN